MQSDDTNFYICSEGRRQMALWDASKAAVTEGAFKNTGFVTI